MSILHKQPQRELQYRPQAAKTLRAALIAFITREFPRLGGPWVITHFVDKLLSWVAAYHLGRDRLRPGQTLWSAVRIEAKHRRGQRMEETPQLPVILTIVGQEQVAELRAGEKLHNVLKRALVRAAFDAYSQGGVLTTTDLAVLFHKSHSRVGGLICEYEKETGEVVPRRGTVHDIGRTLTHKRIICRKAYLEGKTTPVIAHETSHSAVAVDLLDFARVYFSHVERGMSLEETAFATQRPHYLVKEYLDLIKDFGLSRDQVYARSGVALDVADTDLDQEVDAMPD